MPVICVLSKSKFTVALRVWMAKMSLLPPPPSTMASVVSSKTQSLPSPAKMVSVPAPPKMVLLNEEPVMRSRPALPMTFSRLLRVSVPVWLLLAVPVFRLITVLGSTVLGEVPPIFKSTASTCTRVLVITKVLPSAVPAVNPVGTCVAK